MTWSIIRHDFIRNKAITVALLLFMLFSASLAVLAVVTAVQTFTSIATLYKAAQPPHFVQMHKGEIDREEVGQFMAGHELVTHSQIDVMLDVYGENLTVISSRALFDLSDCRLDIGLVKQNATRDLLLDSRHEKVVLRQGEMGIPILLKEKYGIQIGDHVVLTSNTVEKEFIVTEFIVDSMMNSTMAASTRILVSDEDFDGLVGSVGEIEYLIEAYFTTPDQANAFKTAYEDASLPQNGQSVTYAILFILSALTDIVMVFVLLLVSLLLVIVSFICVKYTILAALEEDVREIGTMKAIGLPFADIRDLYLAKYRALALVGVIIGYGIALLGSGFVTKHISTTFGAIRFSFVTIAASLAVGLLVFLLITYYCKKTLKKITKLSVYDALVSGKGFSKDAAPTKDGLYKVKGLPVNLLMAGREVLYTYKNWILIFSVVLITVMMIMIPINLLYTFEAPAFITYMGSSLEDILIEVENGEKLEANFAHVQEVLGKDDSIQDYYVYRTTRVKAANSQDIRMNLDVDSGETSGDGLQYLSGRSPKGQKELALSYLNAEEFGKKVGDTIILMFDGQQRAFVLSGIYQEVTSGGITAKAKYDFPGIDAKKYAISVNLKDTREIGEKVSQWGSILGAGVTVDPMAEFINQTLGGVAKQLRAMVFAILVIGSTLAMLITILFLKLRLAKDFSEIATLQAIGFSRGDIQTQYMIKIGLVSMAGILAGVVLTGFLGEKIVNAALGIASIGIRKVHLIVNFTMQYLLCPLVLMSVILIVTATVMGTREKQTVASFIKE